MTRGENWRERQRAQTLLHLDDGLSSSDVAQIVGIHAYTVSRTRRDWFADGLGTAGRWTLGGELTLGSTFIWDGRLKFTWFTDFVNCSGCETRTNSTTH